ncbi:MAG: hypothetical protein ACI4L2_06450 [Wujia sp.]
MGQGYSYTGQDYTNSEYMQSIDKKNLIDKELVIKYILIIASLFFLFAPAMTFSKVKIEKLSLKFNMFELVSVSDTVKSSKNISHVTDFYINNYEKVANMAKNGSDKVGDLKDFLSNLSFLDYIPVINAYADSLDGFIEVLQNVENVLNKTADILESDSNLQIVDTMNISIGNKWKLMVLIIALFLLGIMGILLVVFDKVKIIMMLSVVGIVLFIIATTTFEHMFLSMGFGGYMILIASLAYFVCGICCIIRNKRTKTL